MKRISILAVFVFLFAILSCKRVVEIAIPIPLVEGAPSTASMSVNVQKTVEEEAEFTVDLYVINKNGRFIAGLQKSNFQIAESAIHSFNITDVNLQSLQKKSGGYSALMLFDQSGSIRSNDPKNLRIEAARTFLSHLGRDDNAAIASFTTDYSRQIYPNYTKYHNEFSRDTTYMKAVLDSLKGNEWGGTPLYRSIYEAVDFTAEKSKNTNKSIIVFTDGDDTEAGRSIDEVVRYAQSKDVPLFTVGLSRGVDVRVLARIANESSGGFFWAQEAKQLISSFSTLGRLLSGSTHLYRTTWKAKNKSRAWKTGDIISGTIKISLPSGEVVDSPFWVQI